MRHAPDQPPYRFAIAITPFGAITLYPGRDFTPAWTTQWAVELCATTVQRLTPPAEICETLARFLTRQSEAHCSAVGGPLDGLFLVSKTVKMTP